LQVNITDNQALTRVHLFVKNLAYFDINHKRTQLPHQETNI